jgi:two-component system OmpR family response regulator
MDFEPASNVVDVYVGYLRSKIDKGFDVPMLRTVRGHGYMLENPQ